MKNNRRGFLKLTGLTGIGLAGTGISPSFGIIPISRSYMEPQPQGSSALLPLNRFPQMIHEYFVGRVHQVEKAAAKRRSGLRTKSDAVGYVHDVQNKIQQCFGPWPEKTPLNARVIRITERDAYNIENVIFESRPGFPVTANHLHPKGT